MTQAAGGIEAVIFDLDGTLVDTLRDIADAMNFALAARGLPTHATADYRRFVGEGVVRLAEQVLPPGRVEMIDELIAAFRERVTAHLLDHSVPYPGVIELIDELAARGLPISVLSNKPDEPTRRIIDALFPRRPFQCVVGERQGVPRKPDPGVALELAREMGIEPERCALVGDTRIDLLTAKAAAMRGIAVSWGFHASAELLAHRPFALIERPEQLLAWLPPTNR